MDTVHFNEMTFLEATSARGLGEAVISCRMVLTMRGVSHPVLMRALKGVDKKQWSEFILALAEKGAHLSFFPESVNTEVRDRTRDTPQAAANGTEAGSNTPKADRQAGAQVTSEERMDPADLRMMLGFGDART